MPFPGTGHGALSQQLRPDSIELRLDRRFDFGQGGIGMCRVPGSQVSLGVGERIAGGGGHGVYLSWGKFSTLRPARSFVHSFAKL
jgi:hypothetical protein